MLPHCHTTDVVHQREEEFNTFRSKDKWQDIQVLSLKSPENLKNQFSALIKHWRKRITLQDSMVMREEEAKNLSTRVQLAEKQKANIHVWCVREAIRKSV